MQINNKWIEEFVAVRSIGSENMIKSLKNQSDIVSNDPEFTPEQKSRVINAMNRKMEQEIGYQRCLLDLKFASTF